MTGLGYRLRQFHRKSELTQITRLVRIVLFAACLCANTAIAGINEWTYLGLAPEKVITIAVDPTNPNIIYAGAVDVFWDSTREGGLFKTIDHGLTWDTLGFRHTNVFQVTLGPQNSSIVWIANGYEGFFRSTDAGQTWESRNEGIDLLPFGFRATEVKICPADASQMVAVITHPEAPSRAYASWDGGETWNEIEEPNLNAPDNFQFDAVANGIVYCFTEGDAGFARAEQCGPPFESSPMPMIEAATDFQVAPRQAGKLWWATIVHGGWMSEDFGRTWIQGFAGYTGIDSSIFLAAARAARAPLGRTV